MPIGGQVSAGSGLRLQVNTPGVQDNGSANINGTMIAGRFTTNPAGATAVNNENEIFGGNITGQTASHTMVLFGKNITVDPGNVLFTAIAFGYNHSIKASNSVALGHSCTVGYGSGSSDNVAVGFSCSAGNTVGSAIKNVSMGYNCAATGGTNVAVGSTVQVATTSVGGAECVAFGSEINWSRTGHRECGIFGRGANATTADRINCLVIGMYGGPVGGAWPGLTTNNTIIIGNTVQTIVRIGAYIIGASQGTTSEVLDADKVISSTEGTILHMTHTAAHVDTLPLANSVPSGYRILITDMSGNASAVNTITLATSGADTLSAGAVIITPYGSREVMSDGVSKWAIIRSL